MHYKPTKSLFADALIGFKINFQSSSLEEKGQATMLMHPDDCEMIKKRFDKIQEHP